MTFFTSESGITPFYDPNKSYAENCEKGPFGGFSDGIVYENKGEPKYEFLGHKVYLPFGIPAGPIPNANFCKGGFEKGFDIIMYKTVRTREHPCNPFPNIVPVDAGEKLTLEKAESGLTTAENFSTPIAITNSFGVPSFPPSVWQPDLKRAISLAKKGQLLIATYQGTNTGEGEEVFLQDWITGAQMVKDCGAEVIELDISCPNEGSNQLLCHDTARVEKICTLIKDILGDIPVLLKMSYFSSDEKLKDFIQRLSPLVAGFNAINTIASEVRKPNGEPALPGKGRLYSGVCGAPIKWAGLDMVKRIKKLRDDLNLNFVIIGTGGVTTPEDYKEYIEAGADAVMSATGAMWNTNLAKEIKSEVL